MRRCEVKRNESHLFVSVRGRGVSDQGGKNLLIVMRLYSPPAVTPIETHREEPAESVCV